MWTWRDPLVCDPDSGSLSRAASARRLPIRLRCATSAPVVTWFSATRQDVGQAAHAVEVLTETRCVTEELETLTSAERGSCHERQVGLGGVESAVLAEHRGRAVESDRVL